MDGITILDIGEYIETLHGVWSVGLILSFIFGIFIIILGIITFFAAEDFSPFCMGILSLFIGIVIVVISAQGYLNNGPTIKIPQYKVTISDSVPYNEFTEKYKVLEVEGKIYTVIDKTEYETAKAEIEGS